MQDPLLNKAKWGHEGISSPILSWCQCIKAHSDRWRVLAVDEMLACHAPGSMPSLGLASFASRRAADVQPRDGIWCLCEWTWQRKRHYVNCAGGDAAEGKEERRSRAGDSGSGVRGRGLDPNHLFPPPAPTSLYLSTSPSPPLSSFTSIVN